MTFFLIFNYCMHKKTTTEYLYPVKFDLDLIPLMYAVGFYAHFKYSHSVTILPQE